VLFCYTYTITKLLHQVADLVPGLTKVMSEICRTSVANAVLKGCPTKISGSLMVG
jgi:hypothetical protein